MSSQSTVPPAAVIVPVVGSPVTAPPASPWYLAARRGLQLVIPLLPIVASVFLDAITRGQIQVDPRWQGVLVTLLVCIQVVAKQTKEQNRQDAALELQSAGIPVGTPLHPAVLHDALYTTSTLPLDAPPSRGERGDGPGAM